MSADLELDAPLLRRIARALHATSAVSAERVQTLWAGYGEIRRVETSGGRAPSVIVKRIRPPATPQHRRGWDGARSQARKLRSYQVEAAFYARWASRCSDACRTARAWLVDGEAGVLVLEDLDAAGFPGRRERCSLDEARACLSWLAHFHATFLHADSDTGVAPGGDDLWPIGTYWHLDTRPDELAAMGDGPLRDAAGELDARLTASRFQSLVHGDAKLANFCFAADGAVAAVDFQYVGGGCGMKDVAYFLSSALGPHDSERHAGALLDDYFATLRRALASSGRALEVDADALEAQWRALYPLAWADFIRFLDGWAPEHPKHHRYSRTMVDAALAILAQAKRP